LPVKHAVLGMLMERPSYGYAIANRLSERLGPELAISESTVHTSLRSMKARGEVEVVGRRFRGEQTATVFAPTQKGVDLYERWLGKPLARTRMRDDLYLKFALVDPDRLPKFREEFQRLELECVEEIAAHTVGVPLTHDLSDPVSWRAARRLLLDSRALDHLNGDLAFIRRTLGVLRWADAQGGTVPRDRLLEAVS